jgi:hypothetical protein
MGDDSDYFLLYRKYLDFYMLYNYNLIDYMTKHRHSVTVTILVYGLYRATAQLHLGQLELADRRELSSRES